MISFNDIYRLFHPIKAIVMPSDDELQVIATRSNKSIDEIRASKAIQIQQNRAKMVACFNPYMANPKFRAFLRNNRASQFEDILFGEHDSFLIKTSSPVEEEIISRAFNHLNQEYNYFLPEDFEQFQLFFKTCQFISEVVENNNSDDNRVAFLHAYKLMVLFKSTNPNRPFDSIDLFLRLHKTKLIQNVTPIHDLLIHDIPSFKNEPSISPEHLDQWRILIHASGPKAIILFQQAKAINAYLGRAPKSCDEAQVIASQIAYPRAFENPKLASLCLQYNLNEKQFNQCLDVEQRRKIRDNLPPCQLDGGTVGHPGYFLVKLPIDDLRAYILGYLTNCCQSIGGDSERCVIDGITSENCGFYVLLKGPIEGYTLAKGGPINDEAFRLVGQGYAWLSTNDVLVFDSWENLRPEDDPVIDSMLRLYASQVTAHQHSEIVAVSIGTGGKTPETLGQNSNGLSSEIIYETMKEGKQYDDSANQWVLAFNRSLFARLRQEMNRILRDAINRGFTGLHSLLNCVAKNKEDFFDVSKRFIYPNKELIQLLNQLFLQHESYAFWQKVLKGNFTRLEVLVEFPSEISILCQILVLVKDLGLLSHDKANSNFELIINNHNTKLLEALTFLRHGLVTEEQEKANFNAMVAYRNLKSLIKALSIAQKYDLLTGEKAQINFEALIKHQNLLDCVRVLLFSQENYLFVGEEAQSNFEAIIKHQNPGDVLFALFKAQKKHLLIGDQTKSVFEGIIRPPQTSDRVKQRFFKEKTTQENDELRILQRLFP